jgi:hypothetical protein
LPPLIATQITPSARRWLENTTSARVLNSFDRACNLINQDGDILALVTSDSGLTPFSILIPTDDPAPFQIISTLDSVRVETGQLVVGLLIIDTTSMRLWEPTPDWPAVRRVFSARPDTLAELIGLVMSEPSKGSLLELYDPHPYSSPIGDRFASDGGGQWRGGLLARAGRGATNLARGLHNRSIAQCLAGVRSLAGAGGGLTPAGDDFMVGAMLAVWAGLYGPDVESMCRPIAESAFPLTTTLSAAYLRSAAQGECAWLWHTLFETLIGSDMDTARSVIQTLMAVGHTSGADALAGFMTAAKYKPEAE